MKWISLLLATYFMALSLLSCADASIQSIPPPQQQMASISNPNHDCHHESDASDNCSPFCSCQCCQTNSTAPSFMDGVNLYSTKKINSIYVISPKEVADFDFFVPPRLL